jgi:pimeloyl-ACP methyl ester carboxylesterase
MPIDQSDRRLDRRSLTRGIAGLGLGAALGVVPSHLAAQGATPAPAVPESESARATTLPGFAHHTTLVNGFRMHYLVGGQGEPHVLLHGAFETWWVWHAVMPALAERYTVIVPDLRGAGDSGRPVGGYDKRTMADDVSQLVDQLGFDRIDLVGHDIGLMVAYAFAAAQPERVRRLALLDAPIPGVGPWEAVASSLWHFSFVAVPDLPEALVAGQERLFLSWFYRNSAYNPSAITPADVDEYVRTYAAEGGMRTVFNYFRAFPQDIEDNRALARTPLPMPTLALGGVAGVGEATLASAQAVATDVRGGTIEECGHWIPLERPAELTARLLAFFGEG